MNENVKRKIDLLLKEKRRDEELQEHLDKYDKVNELVKFVELNSSGIVAKCEAFKTFLCDIIFDSSEFGVDFCEKNLPKGRAFAPSIFNEILLALRNLYAQKILELTEDKN
jgi:hypothetical protein